ncbi:MAG TPA: hypothetical protein VG410_03595 [Solirubrobacteraceae bacterium]|jgi:hypothetical protein|nr:hypothetical protein [Solirubrobacteraceae bacterium]
MDASAYAFAHGVRRTRETFTRWRDRPWPTVRRWVAGSLLAAVALLVGVWVVALLSEGRGAGALTRPPFAPGGPRDVLSILSKNLLVLALHAMACVAGFIAGSSLPLQAEHQRGLHRRVHEAGRRVALAAVVGATTFSLCWQAYLLGHSAGQVAFELGRSPGLLLVGLLPHALPELVALFLPLAAWIGASRRGEWDELLAAAVVTVAIAAPVLVVTATWEVYVAPHVLGGLLGY